MYFRRYKRITQDGKTWFQPITAFHYTPEGAMGEAHDEAFRRYPFNHTARQLFLSNTFAIRETDELAHSCWRAFPLGPPIKEQSREVDFTQTLEELLAKSPEIDAALSRVRAKHGSEEETTQ